ncbi:hypothetical protein LSAT2_023014, partial [Lamellibrachia satsuma]
MVLFWKGLAYEAWRSPNIVSTAMGDMVRMNAHPPVALLSQSTALG